MDYRNLDIDDQDESEDKLIASLASGKTVAESAEISGISERTIYRRLKQTDFRRRLAAKRSEQLEAALGDLTDAAAEATVKLHELANSKTEWVAASASRAIMDLTVKLRAEVEVEDRLCAVEDRTSKQNEQALQYFRQGIDDAGESEGQLVAAL